MADPLLSVRRRELAEIDRLLTRGESAQANVIQITGETGIGKTELLTHAVRTAAEGGRLTVFGRAAEFEADEPFGVFLGALEGIAAELPDEELSRLRADESLELASLLPGLAGRVPNAAGRRVPAPERGRHRALPPAPGDLLAARLPAPATDASCWPSMTCTGRTPPRWSCCCTWSAVRPARSWT